MNVSIKILGYEVARIELDLGDIERGKPPAITRGVKKISNLWVRGMTA